MPALEINHLNFERTRTTKVGWGARLSYFPAIVSLNGWGAAWRSLRGTSTVSGTTGLKDVSLKIEDARLVVISGPNGSGKSTLLKHLAGYFGRKDGVTGEIVFNAGGNLLDRSAPELRAWKNRRVAYMTQEAQLDSGLSVLRNVALPLVIRGLKRGEAYRIAREKLQQVGLPGKEKAYPGSLSGGEKQRVALARALAQDADILLLDEPTANIDSENSAKILSILRDQYKQGKIVILVTHDEEMKQDPDFQQVRMEEGRILEKGSVEGRSHYRLKSMDQPRPTLKERIRASLNLLLFALAKNVAPANRKRSLIAALSPALGVAGVDLALELEQNGIITNFRENTAATLGPVTITGTGYRTDTDPLDHLLSRERVSALAATLDEKPATFPRIQAVCKVGVNGKTRGMPLWAVEKGDPLPLASHLVAGEFSFRPGEIYLGEQEARELGLSAESIGRELTIEIYFPEEGVKYGTVKLAGLVSGNVNLAGAAFMNIGYVREQLGITADQAPNFILSFSDVRRADAAAKRLKQAGQADGLAISAFSDNKVYRGTDAYLTLVELQLVTTIFLAAAAFQLYINAKQMTGQEESEIALRGLLGCSRRQTFGEYFGKLMALYGIGTLASVGAYAPIIYHAETHGVSFLAHVLDAISVDWTFNPKTPRYEIFGGAAAIALIAAGASALSVRKALAGGSGREQSSTPLVNLEQGEGNWSWHWSVLNLARNISRNRLTFLVPSAAFFYTMFDTFQYGLLRDSRLNQSLTTTPDLQVSHSDHPNDPLNFDFRPFPQAAVPRVDGELGRTGRVVLLGQLSQPQAEQSEEMTTVYGIDPLTDRALFPRIAEEVVEGNPVTTSGGIILPRKTAEHLGVGVGSAVNLTNQTAGKAPNALGLRVTGIAESANPRVSDHAAWISLADARAIMGLAADEVTELDVDFSSFKQGAQAARLLRTAHPEFRYHDFLSRSKLIVGDWEAGANWLQGIFSTMLLLVGTYGAYSFVSTSLSGRRREIYDMQANGLTLKQINQIISREVALASACGGCVFTTLGIMASLYMEKFGVKLSTFASDGGMMGLPITLDRVHGDLSCLSAFLAGAAASLASPALLRAKIRSMVRPLKEPVRQPFIMGAAEPGSAAAEPAVGDAAISVKGLTVSFNGSQGRSVLNIPKFSVAKGEYVVITGPNGSGKTTLLEALAAMFVPTTGQITVNSRDREYKLEELVTDAARAEYRGGLAIITQNLGLFEGLTVEENVYFGLRGNAHFETYLMPEHIRAQVAEALRKMGLEQNRRTKVSQLSGGQRQRVAIARALAKSPEILLIDEASANLDHESKEQLLAEVSRLNQRDGITVVFVSHDDLVKEQAGVRVVKIVQGEIVN
jgi:ABC-type lipoprotein export system ATPase subunit/ABC-type lipoprotein release transport system permease subunit